MRDGTRLTRTLDALAHERRRDVLDVLLRAEETVYTADHDLLTEMYHTHLPKLADSDYVEYERDGRGIRVRRGEAFGEVADVYHRVVSQAPAPPPERGV